MRITVKTHGHQFYDEVTGDVLYWCQAVESYSRQGMLQVPAVILDTGDGVKVVPLQKDLYWTEIEKLSDQTGDNS